VARVLCRYVALALLAPSTWFLAVCGGLGLAQLAGVLIPGVTASSATVPCLAVACAASAIGVACHRQAVLPSYRAVALLARYEQDEEAKALDAATLAARRAVTGRFGYDRPLAWLALGWASRLQAERPSQAIAIDQAVDALTRSVKMAPAGTRLSTGAQLQLAMAAAWRFEHRHQSQDAELVLSAVEAVVADRRHGVTVARDAELVAAGVLVRRYEIDGRREDVERAVELADRSAAANGAPGPAELATRAWARLRHSEVSDDGGDVDTAVELAAAAAAQLAPGTRDHAVALGHLARAHLIRYARTGARCDREAAEAAARELVRPTGHDANRGDGLLILSQIQREAALAGEPDALDQAVDLAEEGYREVPGGVLRAQAAQSLGLALMDRYLRRRRPSDLQRAVEIVEEELRDPAATRRLLPDLQSLAAGALMLAAHNQPDRAATLRRAAEFAQSAALATPAGDLNRAGMFITLGQVIGYQIDAGADGDDLVDREVQAFSAAVDSAAQSGGGGMSAARKGLALALRDRGLRRREPEDLNAAVVEGERALAAARSPLERVPKLDALASVHGAQHELTGSPDALERATARREEALHALAENFAFSPIEDRLGERIEWSRLHDDLVRDHLALAAARPEVAPERRRRAMVVAEAAKARLLGQALARGELPAPPGADPAELQRERELLEQLRRLDVRELSGTAGLPSGQHDRKLILESLRATWSAIAAAGPAGQEHVAVRRGAAATWDELAALPAAPGTAVLSLYTLAQQSVLFVLQHGDDAPVAIEANVGFEQWERAARRLQRHVRRVGHGRSSEPTWLDPIRPLLEGAVAALSGVQRIIVSAHRAADLLPWAAALELCGVACEGQPLCVTTVPGLGALHRVRARPPAPAAGTPLVVGHNFLDLHEAEPEAAAVGRTLGVDALLGASATRDAVVGRLVDAPLAHFATHARFDPRSPMQSSVELADGSLTAGSALSLNLRTDLVVLSACEAGISARLAGDERVGVTHAFLHAGARAVIGALWSVDDAASAALMEGFHERRARHGDTALALAEAQAATRRCAEWSSFYYWAGFAILGDST
jgi:CHAT domain